jgi:Circadian oscillating protein COP23
MKSIIKIDIILAGIVTVMMLAISPSVQAQNPLVIKGNQTPTNRDDVWQEPLPSSNTAVSTSRLKVNCQNLKTVVQKGDREAVMLSWSYGGFGKEYTPAKRCQIVSARLQKAANSNGGTFRDMQLASGALNNQTVICALRSKDRACSSKNLLFTLKPENAKNPEAIIEQIFSFSRDGNSTLEESASSKRKINTDLGDWEQKVFADTAKKSPASNNTNNNTGF